VLKPQDLVVAIRLAIPPAREWTYPALGAALHMSASEVHAAVKRAAKAGLVDEATRTARKAALLEVLVHGVRYFLPPVWTSVTRGIPTAHATPPLSTAMVSEGLPPVWPHPEGSVRGQGLKPIYKSVPDAAREDAAFHEWLALVDAVRAGRARDRELATTLLKERLA
jgi:hypothetical protein